MLNFGRKRNLKSQLTFLGPLDPLIFSMTLLHYTYFLRLDPIGLGLVVSLMEQTSLVLGVGCAKVYSRLALPTKPGSAGLKVKQLPG